MPRKDPEKYREYMREYSRRKSAEKKLKNFTKKDNFVEKQKMDSKIEQDVNQIIGVINAIDQSPTIQFLLQAGQGFLKKLVEAPKEGKIIEVKPKKQTIPAPEGWIGMSPMMRLRYKYEKPQWYKQGEAYEKAKNGATFEVSISTPPKPSYSEVPIVENIIQKPEVIQNENNNEIKKEVIQPQSESKSMDNINQDSSKKEIKKLDDYTVGEFKKMKESNNKFLAETYKVINDLSNDEFLEHLNKIERYKAIIPIYIKKEPIERLLMLQETSFEQIEFLFKENCPEKYNLISKEKLEEIKTIYEEIKDSL